MTKYSLTVIKMALNANPDNKINRIVTSFATPAGRQAGVPAPNSALYLNGN
jgi:hypothetical protein